MKAWRYQPTSGKFKNRRAAKRAGSVNRNSWFAGGSRLIRFLISRSVA